MLLPLLRLSITVLIAAGTCAGLDPGRQLSQYTLRTWTQAQGLPQDSVRALAQTPDGYLWVGTDEGLARFDGYSFSIVPSAQIPGTAIRALCVASDGTLWIGTAAGLASYRDGKYSRVSNLGTTPVAAIAEGPDRTIWIAAGMRLIRFSGGAYTNYGPESGLSIEGVRALLPIGPNEVIVAGYGAVGTFRNGSIVDVSSTAELGGTVPTTLLRDRAGTLLVGGTLGLFARELPDRWRRVPEFGVFVRALAYDRDGNIWVGTNAGLVRWQPGSLTTISHSEAFAADWIWCIFEDREGTLWVGTNNGLHQFVDQSLAVYGRPEGLPSDEPVGVAQDAVGRIWTGFHNGGIGYIDKDRFIRRLPDEEVLCIRGTKRGHILVGTRSGIHRISAGAVVWSYRSKDALGRANVFDAAEDASGALWLGTNAGLLKVEGTRSSAAAPGGTLLDEAVVTVLVARDGTVWAGTYANGLWRVNGSERVRYTTAAGLPSDQIRSLYEDGSGVIWIATFGGGLAFFRNGTIGVVPASAGLPSQNVGAIIGDGPFLWLATTRGIVRLQREALLAPFSEQARLYGTEDGLRSSNAAPGYPTSSGGIRASDGSVWFPTARGLVRLGTDRVRSSAPLPVLIVDTTADGVPWDRSELSADTRRVEFRYAAVHLVAPSSVRYRFSLEPIDKGWIDARGMRVASYSNLRKGQYRFRVSAAVAGSNEWHEAAPIVFRKQPSFYETYWFFALLAATGAALIWSVWRYRLRQERRRFAVVLEERSRIARELHDTLAQGYVGIASQLAAVQSVMKAQPDLATRYLELARRMAEYSVAEARRSIADLRSGPVEPGGIGGHIRLAVDQVIAGRDVQVNYDFSGALESLPPATIHQLTRIAQEAVTNAVTHAAPSHLEIRVYRQDGLVHLTIVDDGQGFDAADDRVRPGHFGLIGMRERAEALGGTFRLDSAVGRGTTIEVQVPTP